MGKNIWTWVIVIAVLVVIVVSVRVATVSHNDDGLTATQNKTRITVADIQKRSDGNWDHLSAQDKKFLVDMANGNEQAARQQFSMWFMGGGPGPKKAQ